MGLSTHDAAVRYFERGWSVVPIVPEEKVPPFKWKRYETVRADKTQFDRWFENGSPLGIGIVTGSISGIVVLDTDTEEAERWVREQRLPDTIMARTPRGGHHRYFSLPEGVEVRNSAGALHAGVDVRGEGGLVVAPPTPGYVWEPLRVPVSAWPFAPDVGRRTVRELAPGETIAEGGRNDTLASIAGSLRRRGAAESAIVAALLAINVEQCDPPLPDDEVRAIAASIATYEPEPVAPPVVVVEESDDEIVWHVGGEEEGGDEADEIVPGIIFRGARHLVVSLPKSGKSVFALAMCGAIRNRENFLTGPDAEGFPTEPARVLYLTEEPVSSFTTKLERYGLAHDHDGFQYLRRFQPIVSGMEWPDVVQVVLERATQISADMVVIDVLHRWANFAEGQENDSGVVSRAIRQLDPFVEANITTVILHHATWAAKRARGSTDILGSVDMSYFIEGSGTEARTFSYQGGRYETEFTAVSYRLDSEMHLESMGKMSPKASAKTAQLMSVIDVRGPSTSEEIADDLGWSERTAQRWAERAFSHHLISRDVGLHGKFLWVKRHGTHNYWGTM